MQNFRTYQLAKALFHNLKVLNVKGEMKDQLERASLSIVLNLAEGSAKTGKDRKRFFTIAMGSLKETQAIIDLMEHQELMAQANIVAACLYKLLQNPGPGPAA